MTRKNILVTGGAGFIGTQLVHALAKEGHDIVVVDRNIKKDLPAVLWEGDYAEYFESCTFKFDLVIHLAAEASVPNSVLNPAIYYENNVVKMQSMLDSMRRIGMDKIIFSSTGNVYGNQQSGKLSEVLPYAPINPYACTKAIGEMMLKNYAEAYGMQYTIFRYFNVTGADPKCRFGYDREPATHLVPNICKSILDSEEITIYGNDYNTPDGTCIRDYLHVADLADAHLKAIKFMDTTQRSEIFNLGGGTNGISVKKLVETALETIGYDMPVQISSRRTGDPDSLIADISKATYLLKWTPEHNIRQTILHAWNWEESKYIARRNKNV